MDPAMASSIKVFSAPAEVVLEAIAPATSAVGILRARGGSSTAHAHLPSPLEYSPRTRR